MREERHRLPLSSYRGKVAVAFTVNAKEGTESLLHPVVFEVARTALSEAFEQHGGHCAVYLFMPDHLHLIVSGAGPESDLHAMISLFKQKTTYRLHQADQSFAWQKDFYDHIIRATEDYGAQVRYLLRNPVRQGLCERWEDWAYKGVLGQTWEELLARIVTM